MDKSKALMLGVIGVLLVVVGVLSFREIMSPSISPEEHYLRIEETAHSATDAEDARFSKNPPYFVSEKYYWWIQITVSADANVSDIAVYDQLGVEFMIEGVSFVPIEKPGPYNYTFDYGAYESGGDVNVTDGASVWTGYLNETGVTFDAFVVYWSDESLRSSFEWSIGSMSEGEVKEIYLTISTDVNPNGLQEFTWSGMYFLDSGATIEGIVESTGGQTTAESAGIEIEVLEKTD